MKNIFNRIKFSKAIGRKREEKLYSQVSSEMASGQINQGLWTKSIEKSEGDSGKQVSEYIRLRVQSLYDELEISKKIEHQNNIAAELTDDEPTLYESFCNYIKNDNVNGVVKLVSEMSSKELVKLVQSENEMEEYPIHIAAREGSLKALEWLIQNGADIRVTNYWNSTPLQVAQNAEQEQAVAIILNHSA